MDKENNPAPENDSGNKGQEEKPTTFTQEQVNDIVSKRLAEANTKAEKKLKDEVSKALAEAERQSKLSEAEREKEFKAKQQKELDDRERTITLRERRADAKGALSDRDIDTDLVDFVIDIDEDKTNANIDKLEKVDDYGTARAAGAGKKILNTGKVTININEDKEIVEEIAKKDVKLYGIASIMDKRKKNQALRMIADLDTRFFAQMVTDGTEITGLTAATPLVDNLESIIQSIETTQNDWVDGVDREMIEISVKPAIYGKLLNYIDSVPNPISGLKEDVFHGVKIYSNHRQTKDIICAIHGAVGQSVTVDDYEPEKIQLSNSYGCSLFYSRGTKAVMPDLIRYVNIAEA